VISSLVSRFEAVLIEISCSFVTELGIALPFHFAPPVHGPLFGRACLVAFAGGTFTNGSEINDITHAMVATLESDQLK
jgi:hypothetical protein